MGKYKGKISIEFYVNVEKYFRSEELRKEFIKKAYEVFMEKEDSKSREFSYEEINKYIDLKKYCEKYNPLCKEGDKVNIKHTFYRDASSRYAQENGKVKEWNDKFTSVKKKGQEALDSYVAGTNTKPNNQTKALRYVERYGSESDKKVYELTKSKNFLIGSKANITDCKVVYLLYKAHGLSCEQIEAYLKGRKLNYTRRNGLIEHYIKNAIEEELKDEELGKLYKAIEAERKHKDKNRESRRDVIATGIFNKLLSFNESNLEIALNLYNQKESLSREELLAQLEALRGSSKYNEICHFLYGKFLEMYPDEEDIADSVIIKLIEKPLEHSEVYGLKCLYDTKRTANDCVRIIRSLVDNGIVNEREAIPLKTAVNKLSPATTLVPVESESSLVKGHYYIEGKEISKEDKEQVLAFLSDNGIEINSITYIKALRNHVFGNMDVYGKTEEEIFKVGKHSKIKK